jgi:hypothetical protein
MNILNNYRWVGLLLMIGAVAAAITTPIENYYHSEEGLAGIPFNIWFICNTVGMIGLSFYYSSAGNKSSGWINFIGLVSLYTFWMMTLTYQELQKNITVIGIGVAFIQFSVAVILSKEIPRWVAGAWLLAGITSFAALSIPQTGFFSIFNWWNLGLVLASFGTGITLWRKPNEELENQP